MSQRKINYDEAINFILGNFDSYQDLISVINKYKGKQRLTNLPEIDDVMFSNLTLISSIAGEIGTGDLDLFGTGLPQDKLVFWIKSNFPTKDKLESLIELYTNDGHLDNIHQDLRVINNFDRILEIYHNLYLDNQGTNTNVETQIVDQQTSTKDNIEINEERAGVKTFTVELFDMNNRKSFSDIATDQEFLDTLIGTLQMLQFKSKEAHWIINGPGFKGIHEVFEELYGKFGDYVDELVESRMANKDEFSKSILGFINNSIVTPLDPSTCSICQIDNDIILVLNLLTSRTIDALYSDLTGRLTTDLLHYKYMLSGYLKAIQGNSLTDEYKVIDPVYDSVVEVAPRGLPAKDVINEVLDNSLVQIKSFCKTKNQRKVFNELLKSFK